MEEKSNDIIFNIAYTRINTMRVTYIDAATSETRPGVKSIWDL